MVNSGRLMPMSQITSHKSQVTSHKSQVTNHKSHVSLEIMPQLFRPEDVQRALP